jgi:hypothetical protein
LIQGAIEIETTLGEKRQFKAGQVLLLEDTEGKGHRTRNIQPTKGDPSLLQLNRLV